MKYYVFGPVRNCEGSIERVMASLFNQSIPPEKIIIVNDGSTDKTGEILERYRKEHPETVDIITTKSTTNDFSRLPSLWNMCLQERYDYHMIINGDTILERDYAKKILWRMRADDRLVIASGYPGNKKSKNPRGAGRFVKQDFFYKFYEKYPEILGYESEITLKALIEGYKTEVVADAKFEHTDKLGHSHGFNEFGWAMRALDYHPMHVLVRIIQELIGVGHAGKIAALKMFYYYLTFKPESKGYYSLFPEETRKAIRNYQGKHMRRRLKKLLSHD